MGKQLVITAIVALGFTSAIPCHAGTEIVRDYSAQAPAPTYSDAPAPPPPVYYVPPPPVRVVVYPAYAPVVRILGFHRFVRRPVYCGPGYRHY